MINTVVMRILQTLFLCLLLVPVSGQVLHVNEGDRIQDALDRASPFDTIVVHEGVYFESLQIDRPVFLHALNGGEATITNRFAGEQKWIPSEGEDRVWVMEGVRWPVHWLLVEGVHAFDYRSRVGFDAQRCGPYWSKGWQETPQEYSESPLYFAWDRETRSIWLKLDDPGNPNDLDIAFNSQDLDGTTLVQKDLGEYWNQQQIVTISRDPPVHPVTMWYSGTPAEPEDGRIIDFPPVCGIVIDIRSDSVSIEGFRIHLAPTVGIEVNDSKHVTIRNCYFSGFQFGINTGYRCTDLTVEHCEFDGGELITTGGHTDVTHHMWNHSTYVIPVKFNGTGLTFHHNYVYEGYDLFQPRGRHRDFPDVPDLMSDVAFNVWHQAIDNHLEFDGVEATIRMRFHHNLILGRGTNDMLAITTTENGDPLMIDHNLFWNGGDDSRIMKLVGTRRRNNGIFFIHNTYLTGAHCSAAPFGPDCIFENNIVVSSCSVARCWNHLSLNTFLPTRYNLCTGGDQYIAGFKGITASPGLGGTPESFFCLQQGSPAIDAGVADQGYYQGSYSGDAPDLGALESTQDVDDWAQQFGHCGPEWIRAENAAEKAPHRPEWPALIDKCWGGLGGGNLQGSRIHRVGHHQITDSYE